MRKRHKKLTSVRDLQKFVSRALNERRSGQIDSSMCRDLIYGCKVLSDILEKSDFEERIAALENGMAAANTGEKKPASGKGGANIGGKCR